MAKRNKYAPCVCNTTDEHYKKMLWCMNQDIKVYPKFVKNSLHIVIDNPLTKKRLTVSTESYTNCEIQQVIWDLYIKIYNKYKKKL